MKNTLKKTFLALTLSGLTGALWAATAPAAATAASPSSTTTPAATPVVATTKATAVATPAARSPQDKISYSIGVDIGRNFKAQNISIDLNTFSQGLQDGMNNQPTMTDTEIQQTLAAFQQDLIQKRTAELKKIGDKNKAEGDVFLANNKKQAGVTTLPSGLQYKVVTAGKGPKPSLQDTVTTHYRGRLLDGTEFDSSYGRNEPVTFPVNGVIPGWSEALQLMPVGSKWELVIPSNLAYGEYGAGNKIGPNATLLFEVELLSIEAPKAPAAATPAAKTATGKK